MSDNVSPELLEMSKVVSEDLARRAIKRIDEEKGIQWLQNYLYDCYEPLLKTPWILDVDTTAKPRCGHQEDATYHQSHSTYSLPGLVSLLKSFTRR